MLLPGRLESTTLGDILGQLHRGRASGVLELHEVGQVHRVGLRDGLVVAVQTPLLASRLGDILRRHEPLSVETRRALERAVPHGRRIGQWLLEQTGLRPELLASALRRQQRERLEQVYRVSSAHIRFRAASWVHAPTSLEAREFLHGRPRHRDRLGGKATSPRGAALDEHGDHDATWSAARPHVGRSAKPSASGNPARQRAGGTASAAANDADAWSQLELQRGASRDEIRASFRRLARRLHPDAWVDAPWALRDRAARRFARLSQAYHELMRVVV